MRTTTSICLLLFLFSFHAHAQFKKGDRMVGASIASIFYNNTTGDVTVGSVTTHSLNKNYSISIGPMYGWFITNKTVVGGTLNINPTGQTVSYESNGNTYQKDKTSGLNLGAGAFARSYFSNDGSFLPFGQFAINGGVIQQKTSGFYYGGTAPSNYKLTYKGESSSGSFVNISALAGVTKMLSESVGLDIYVGYNYSSTKNNFHKTTQYDLEVDGTIDNEIKSESSSTYTNHGLLVGIGLQIFLGKK
ncbi:MAG TPA: hypothetical protein VFZ42_17265 [Chitinophagaceae bacterium]